MIEKKLYVLIVSNEIITRRLVIQYVYNRSMYLQKIELGVFKHEMNEYNTCHKVN